MVDEISILEGIIKGKFLCLSKNMAGSEVIQEKNLLVINSGLNSDMFNQVICEGHLELDQILKAVQYFRIKGLPFAWWQGFRSEEENIQTLLEQAGLNKTEEELAMAVLLKDVRWPDPPAELEIKPANDSKTICDLIQVMTSLLPHEAAAIRTYYQKAIPFLCTPRPQLRLFVGYWGKHPVGSCSVFFEGQAAGIFDIIALSDYRGKGIGSAMTCAGLAEAKKNQIPLAVLTATNDAKFLYEKLGFRGLKNMAVFTQ